MKSINLKFQMSHLPKISQEETLPSFLIELKILKRYLNCLCEMLIENSKAYKFTNDNDNLFRAIAQGLYNDEDGHQLLKKILENQIKDYSNEFIEPNTLKTIATSELKDFLRILSRILIKVYRSNIILISKLFDGPLCLSLNDE